MIILENTKTTSNTEVVSCYLHLFYYDINKFSWLQQSADRLLEVGDKQTNEAIVTW